MPFSCFFSFEGICFDFLLKLLSFESILLYNLSRIYFFQLIFIRINTHLGSLIAFLLIYLILLNIFDNHLNFLNMLLSSNLFEEDFL